MMNIYQLTNVKTSKPICVEDKVKTMKGETGVLLRFEGPTHFGNVGRVHVDVDGEIKIMFPAAIGAQFREFETYEQCKERLFGEKSAPKKVSSAKKKKLAAEEMSAHL